MFSSTWQMVEFKPTKGAMRETLIYGSDRPIVSYHGNLLPLVKEGYEEGTEISSTEASKDL